MEMMRVPSSRGEWAMTTSRPASKPNLDGTIVEDRSYPDAGATTAQGPRCNEPLHLIRKAGREPIERDTLYRPVQRTESTFTGLV
jgi:aminodeoxyfutalosine synthase